MLTADTGRTEAFRLRFLSQARPLTLREVRVLLSATIAAPPNRPSVPRPGSDLNEQISELSKSRVGIHITLNSRISERRAFRLDLPP